jgi:hypothetical protein
MQYRVYLYCSENFDGRLCLKIDSRSAIASATATLLRDGQAVAEEQTVRTFVLFKDVQIGVYQAIVRLTLVDGTAITVESGQIHINKPPSAQASSFSVTKQMKGGQRLYGNVSCYTLELKLQKGGLERLRSELAATLPRSHHLLASAPLQKINLQPYWDRDLEEEYERYKIASLIPDDELIPIAQELELLDYVIYCAVAPASQGIKLPQQQPTEITGPVMATGNDQNEDSGDFVRRQTYLRADTGMNVLGVWERGQRGDAATVRIMEIGLFPNHEDLVGNITVVSSGTQADTSTGLLHHGTATTGCIAASNNQFGVTGIASGCDCYFYAHGSFDQMVSEAVPGDLVLINLEFIAPNGNRIPVIDERSWWDRIQILSNRGIVVILAAGNGSLDLSVEGIINDYGDSGGTLVGACEMLAGRRLSFSNYGHQTSLYNSWGHSVATTGYGDLQFISNDRSYTGHYNGTSSAAALCCGAIALIQAHAISTGGTFLGPQAMRILSRVTGYAEGVQDGIGRRPNTLVAVNSLTVGP